VRTVIVSSQVLEQILTLLARELLSVDVACVAVPFLPGVEPHVFARGARPCGEKADILTVVHVVGKDELRRPRLGKQERAKRLHGASSVPIAS
jgi:hypothetical protein